MVKQMMMIMRVVLMNKFHGHFDMNGDVDVSRKTTETESVLMRYTLI